MVQDIYAFSDFLSPCGERITGFNKDRYSSDEQVPEVRMGQKIKWNG